MTGPLDRLDASQYGDGEEHRPAHVAPLCDECGEEEAVDQEGGRDLCADCLGEEGSA